MKVFFKGKNKDFKVFLKELKEFTETRNENMTYIFNSGSLGLVKKGR